MQFKTLLVGIAAMGFASVAGATSYTSNVTSTGNWDDSSSWSPTGVPGAADSVEILNGDTITVRFAENVNNFDIDAGGKLVIDADAMLLVDGGGGADDYLIDGAIEIGTGSGGGNLTFSGASVHTLFGAGYIEGKHANSAIDLVNGKTVVNQLDLVKGMLTIAPLTGTATWTNYADDTVQAEMRADAAGAFVFASGLILLDDDNTVNSVLYRPLYKVDGGAGSLPSVMQFNRAQDGSSGTNPVLKGNFIVINCGHLDINAAVETTGSLTQNNGGQVTTNGSGAPCFVFSGGSVCDSQTVGSCP